MHYFYTFMHLSPNRDSRWGGSHQEEHLVQIQCQIKHAELPAVTTAALTFVLKSGKQLLFEPLFDTGSVLGHR